MSPPRILLILGMHRSGTSMLAELCGTFGLTLPRDLMAGNEWNPHGYFEPMGVWAAHQKLLKALERPWFDPRPLPKGWLDSDATRQCRQTLLEYLSKTLKEDSAPLVIKDPRTTRLLPLWKQLAKEHSYELSALLALRPMGEVVQSLDKRDDLNPLVGAALWWQHMEEAIANLSSLPNAVAPYHAALDRPRLLHELLKNQLSLPVAPWDETLAEKASKATEQTLRHHQGTPAELVDTHAAQACHALYEQLAALPNITAEFTLPSSDAFATLQSWLPEWLRLFARHHRLKETSRGAQKELQALLLKWGKI